MLADVRSLSGIFIGISTLKSNCLHFFLSHFGSVFIIHECLHVHTICCLTQRLRAGLIYTCIFFPHSKVKGRAHMYMYIYLLQRLRTGFICTCTCDICFPLPKVKGGAHMYMNIFFLQRKVRAGFIYTCTYDICFPLPKVKGGALTYM